MRRALSLAATLVLLAALARVAVGQEEGPPRSRLAETVFVEFREIFADYGYSRALSTLRPGEPRKIDEPSPTPYLIGLTETIDPETKAIIRKPHIATIDEGTRIDATIVGRTAEGATVDITVERTIVTKVEKRQDESGKTIQIPTLDTRKKRVIQFVEFDHTLAIPLGVAQADGKTPRVEILLGAGDVIRCDWTVPDEIARAARTDDDAVFDAISAAGGEVCTVYYKESHRNAWLGPGVRDLLDIGTASVAELAETFEWCGTPVRVVGALATILNNEISTQAIESAVYDGGVAGPGRLRVLLRDSPTLVSDVKLLKRLPEPYGLTIYVDEVTDDLLHALGDLTQLNVLVIYAGEVTDELRQALSELHVERVIVLDAAERGEASVAVVEYDSNVDGSARLLEKTVRVSVLDAEAAIPHLKTLPKLEHVLIDVHRPEHEARARKAQWAVQQALPNAAIHVVLYTGHWPKK
jgi:hypothetical protein